MRWINLLLSLLMLVFILVQYNDPDGLLWMCIYAVPMVWAAVAGLRPDWLKNQVAGSALLITVLCAFAGTLYLWPKSEGWWRKDIWWEQESVREGMGMMIVLIVLLIVWVSRRLWRQPAAQQARTRDPG